MPRRDRHDTLPRQLTDASRSVSVHRAGNTDWRDCVYSCDMKVRLRANVDFGESSNLVLDGFLPLLDGAKFVALGDTGFSVAVVMDPAKHGGWMAELDVDDVENHFGIHVVGLWILLDADVDEHLAEALVAGEISEDTAIFGERVLAAINLVHDSIEDFARNEHGQYWLPTRIASDVGLQQQLMRYETRIETSRGWKLLEVAPNDVVMVLEVSRGIDQTDWQKLEEQLARGRFSTLAHRRLIANAFALESRHDLRAAIVEAVAAWEMVISTLIPSLLAGRDIAFDEGEWKRFIENAGLRASTRLVFALLHDIGDLSQRREAVLQALELRNNVIHNGQQRMNPRRVSELLRAVRSAIRACEGERAVPVALRWGSASEARDDASEEAPAREAEK